MVEIFFESLSNDALIQEARQIPDLAAQLEALSAKANDAWPTLPLPSGALVRALGQRLSARPPRGTLLAWLGGVQAPDLHLALACGEGSSAAIEAFEKRYRSDLYRVIEKYQGPRLSREDLLQSLREKLFVSTTTRAARIHDYAGQGHLQNWLRVAAVRTFIDMLRSASRKHQERPTGEEGQILAMPDPDEDVELDFLKREYHERFKEAFAVAARSLSSRERNILRQYLVAGLTVTQLGALYNVNPSTISRWVARAREALVGATRKELMQRLSIDQRDFDSIMELVRSRLELSVDRLLQTVSQALGSD